jgi:hypothetical protein
MTFIFNAKVKSHPNFESQLIGEIKSIPMAIFDWPITDFNILE